MAAAAILAGCGPAPAPVDQSQNSWYTQAVAQVVVMNRQAETAFHNGNQDQAAAVIEKEEPVVNRLLGVPHPSLAALEAASDLDDLYGRMLLSNRHYAWARLQFQKNLARWKHWQPQTPDTLRRLKLAGSEIDECDRRME